MSTLDRLVAKDVMGWELKIKNGKPWWCSQERHTFARMWSEEAWKPSHNMILAMDVVRCVIAMLPTRYMVGKTFALGRSSEWEASFGNDDQGIPLVDARHANPATAICLAAIATVGVEYKESKDE